MNNNLYRIETIGTLENPNMNGNAMLYCDNGIAFVKLHPVRINAKPKSVNTISRGLYEQIKWERDIAISQLESYGIGLGEETDVAKVVHGHWEELGEADYKCSRCGFRFSSTDPISMFKYCRCGAKMDLE